MAARAAILAASAGLIGAAAVAVAPARALSPEVLDSVVSVLPQWPSAAARREEPEASGVALFAGGYVATNVHVLGRARAVKVRLNDGRVLPAEIVGRDPPTDLALIKVPLDLPLLKIGPEPVLAQPVCAIGNQFGLGLSVTCGVVSALGRSNTGFNPIEDFIQTDAAVNPGGSGGALVDAQGRLVGLVSAIFTKRSDADIGINFATSMPLVLRVAEDLKAFGKVRRGRLGVRLEPLEEAQRARLSGVRIVDVTPQGAAEAAGLRVGDVITRASGRAVGKTGHVVAAVQRHRIGEPVELTVLREGEVLSVTVKLKE